MMVILSFYGRFIYAESNSHKGQMRILAVNPGFNSEIGAKKHSLMMTVHRTEDLIVSDGTGTATRVVAPIDVNNSDDEVIWKIEDRDIEIQGLDGFAWEKNDHSLLADLGELTNYNAGLDPVNLAAKRANDLVTSLITVGSGHGLPSQIVKGQTYDFVPFDLSSGAVIKGRLLADRVDIAVDTPRMDMLFRGNRASSKSVEQVSIATTGKDPVMISFSNLCVSSYVGHDTEFAGFYEVLKPPQALGARLVPTPAHIGFRLMSFPSGDCYTPSYIQY